MKYPERRDDVLNLNNSINKLMSLRPRYVSRLQWIRTILSTRHPNLWGDALDAEVKLALDAYNNRPVYRPTNAHYSHTLGPRNRAAKRDKKRREELSIEPPAPLHSGSWQ